MCSLYNIKNKNIGIVVSSQQGSSVLIEVGASPLLFKTIYRIIHIIHNCHKSSVSWMLHVALEDELNAADDDHFFSCLGHQ